MKLVLVALALVVAACGSASKSTSTTSTGGDGSHYAGTFNISGAPHGGTYTDCSVSAFVGHSATLSCTGLGACSGSDCTLSISIPTSSGTFDCTKGQVGITIADPGLPDDGNGLHPAGAGCDPHDQQSPTPTPGDPNPGCPKDLNGCNRVWGSCDVQVSSVTAPGDGAPFGHFSGSISAKLYTQEKIIDCGTFTGAAVEGAGQDVSISVSGSW